MLTITRYEEVTQIKMSRLSESHPPLCACAYLVDGLLIDSGPDCTGKELADFLKDKGVKLLVNTHYHHDHIGGNATLQQNYSLEILAHPAAIDKIEQPPQPYPYQEELWGHALPSQVKKIGNVVKTAHFQFEVIHTPGHSDDHICLFERNKGWLFSGDLATVTHPRFARAEENQWKTIISLKKIKELMPRVLLTAPEYIITEPSTMLEKTIQYLEETGQRIRALASKGLSPAEIAEQLFGEDIAAQITEGQFSSENFVNSYLKTD